MPSKLLHCFILSILLIGLMSFHGPSLCVLPIISAGKLSSLSLLMTGIREGRRVKGLLLELLVSSLHLLILSDLGSESSGCLVSCYKEYQGPLK